MAYEKIHNRESLTSLYAEFRDDLKCALDRELESNEKLLRTEKTAEVRKVFFSCRSKRDSLHRLSNQAKSEIRMILLGMFFLRVGDEGDIRSSVPDEDRAIVNEAIHAKLHPKYIKMIVGDYKRACESGGVVDHVNHPIHLACKNYPKAVKIILNAHPDCSTQGDGDGRLPLELFLESSFSRNISKGYKETIDLFSSLDLTSTRKIFARRKPAPDIYQPAGLSVSTGAISDDEDDTWIKVHSQISTFQG
jgi:hypothetical protein